MKISEIKIGDRFRKNLGHIDQLVQSIKEIGLLHPVVINENYELIAGQRRIEAFKKLGHEDIPATVVNLNDIVIGEFHENAVRKGFTSREKIAIKEAIEPIERQRAKERQGGKGYKQHESSVKSTQRSRDKVADYLETSWNTLDKLETIIKTADTNEKFADFPDKIDSGKLSVRKASKLIAKEEKRQQLLSSSENENEDWTNSDYVWVTSTSGRTVSGLRKPKGLKLSDEQVADLKRQIDEQENRPHYWWLTEEQRQNEIQKDREYEEFDRKHSEPYYGIDFTWNGNGGRRSGRKSKTPSYRGKRLETGWVGNSFKPLLSKKEIIDWLSTMDESARFSVRISYQEKFPPRNRPSPPPDEEHSIKLEHEQIRLLQRSF